MNYMGIDHHKQYSHITLMDKKGKSTAFLLGVFLESQSLPWAGYIVS